MSDETHRWTSSTRLKRHGIGEEIQPGEAFTPTESELRAFGGHIEELEQPTESEESEGDDLDERAIEAVDENYQTVVSAVEDGQCDEFLADLKEADERDSVQNAISDRRDELSDE